jgi:hypothetical protein
MLSVRRSLWESCGGSGWPQGLGSAQFGNVCTSTIPSGHHAAKPPTHHDKLHTCSRTACNDQLRSNLSEIANGPASTLLMHG